MRNVWKIIKDDFKLLFSNVISIVVVIGLIVVPGMYVWFNLAGVWDPYNNVDNLEVAVVNGIVVVAPLMLSAWVLASYVYVPL